MSRETEKRQLSVHLVHFPYKIILRQILCFDLFDISPAFVKIFFMHVLGCIVFPNLPDVFF